MEGINNSIDLQLKIQILEARLKLEELELKFEFNQTLDQFKPISILKNSLSEIVSSSEIKRDLGSISLGMLSGFIAKKVAVGKTTNPFSGLLGNVVQMIVSSEVMKHSEQVKSIGISIFRKLINRNSKVTSENE